MLHCNFSILNPCSIKCHFKLRYIYYHCQCHPVTLKITTKYWAFPIKHQLFKSNRPTKKWLIAGIHNATKTIKNKLRRCFTKSTKHSKCCTTAAVVPTMIKSSRKGIHLKMPSRHLIDSLTIMIASTRRRKSY